MNGRLIGTIMSLLGGLACRAEYRDVRGKRVYLKCGVCGNPSKTNPCFKCQQKEKNK